MLESGTLPDFLHRAAAATPDEVAVAVEGGESLTYRSWDRRSNARARGLQREGIDPGDRVALVFDAARWPEHAVTYLAVQKAAAVPVPLGPELADIEVARILRHCGASAVVAPPDLAPSHAGVPIIDPSELEDHEHDVPLASPVDPSELGEIVYASRPLSRPVALPRSHAALAAGPSLVFGRVGRPRSFLHAFTVGTVAAHDALHASLHPAPVRSVMLPAFEPDRFCALLAAQPVGACGLHPSTARALLDSGATARHDLSRVIGLVVTSGRVLPELLLGLTAAFPLAALVLVDVLGHPPGVRTAFAHDRSRPGAIGRPMAGTEVRVSDEAGRRLEPPEVGRVWVRGAPAEVGGTPGDGGAATGDVGYIDDGGFLYVLSCRRDVVRSHRSTVLRAEVESALRQHHAVVDAAVLGLPDDHSGGELAAAVALGSPVSSTELQALVRARLGEDKAPERVFFVDEVPRNSSGVVLLREVRRRLGLVVPLHEGVESAPMQEAVAAVWRRVLGEDDIGPHDDFFELGGDGFAAATVLGLLEDAFEVCVPVAAFLDAPTVAGLASAVERLQGTREGTSSDVPVAFSQEGMLWHEIFAPGCQNLPGLARRYRGPLDVEALERALDEIVRRHGALRTGFELRDGRPVQVVRPHRPIRLPVRDLTGLAPRERQAHVDTLVADAGRRPFDLVEDALFAPTLLRLADDDHVLVVRTHHSVFDDWSVGVFRRELAALYSAYAAGDSSPLPELPTAFNDFSRRQRRRLAGSAGARQLSFWRRELTGAPFVTQLAVDAPDLPEGAPQVTREPVELRLSRELHEGLRSLARRERATVFMTMLTAFGVLVHRYTGQDDLLLATVVANRNRTELEAVIGCFTKKVPLRLRLSGDPTFAEALAHTRAALLGALSNQDLPFEAVVQDVLGAPAASHGLVPHVALMFQGVTPRQELALPDVETAGFETSTTARRAHFMAGAGERPARDVPPLPWGAGLYLGTFVILSVDESEARLSCVARGAFHAPAVRDLMHSFRTLLADVVAHPTRRVSQLALLDERTRHDVLQRGSGRSEPLPADTLHGAFAAPVRRTPDAIAVYSRARPLTFAELDARSERLARRLRALGTAPGGRVGISLEPSPDAVVAVLAVWKAGAAWVGLDPAEDEERLSWIARDAAIELVVGEPGMGEIGGHARVVGVNGDEGCSTATQRNFAAVGADDDAVVFYGCGRSAVDRGVALDHRAVLNLLTGLRHAVLGPPEAVPGSPRVCLCSPPTQDAFLRQMAALLAGHVLYVPDRPLHADPRAAVSLLAAGKVDLLDCTPEEVQALLDAGLQEGLGKREDGLEPALVVGARAAMRPEVWRTLRSLTGVRPYVMYGGPECAFGATVASAADGKAGRGVGRATANLETYVLDRRGRPVPVRAIGELHIGGRSLARGYLGHPDATRERFVERALGGQSRRLYRTGHLARSLPDGGIELLGSLQGAGNLRGFRVEPERIQSALASCPGVREAAVTLERERGDPRLVAYVVPDGEPPTLIDLRAFLWARLPGYAWPSAVRVVPQLPAKPQGEASDGEPGHTAGKDVRTEKSPEESVLSALWAEVLGVERVGSGENYWQAFSFLEALARARDAGVPAPGEHVTRNRTIATLATALAADRRSEE